MDEWNTDWDDIEETEKRPFKWQNWLQTIITIAIIALFLRNFTYMNLGRGSNGVIHFDMGVGLNGELADYVKDLDGPLGDFLNTLTIDDVQGTVDNINTTIEESDGDFGKIVDINVDLSKIFGSDVEFESSDDPPGNLSDLFTDENGNPKNIDVNEAFDNADIDINDVFSDPNLDVSDAFENPEEFDEAMADFGEEVIDMLEEAAQGIQEGN